MEEDLETPTTATTSTTATTAATTTTTQEPNMFLDDLDSGCSTPYVSAPSSPGRGQPISGYYYSAPTSPMHFMLSTTTLAASISSQAEKQKPSSSTSSSFEFDFSARLTTDGSTSPGKSMSSADELFLNGQIRPMKLSTHLKRPQMLSPLLDCDENDQDLENGDDLNISDTCLSRGRENVKLREKSLRRRTRSMSPLRSSPSFVWHEECETDEILVKNEAKQDPDDNNEEEIAPSESAPCGSEASSRSSSVGRSSKRWVFLKEFLYRSKSEGRNNGHKFWGGLSFSPVKDKKMEKMEKLTTPRMKPSSNASGARSEQDEKKRVVNGKAVNGGVMGKRRVPPSAHELHYTANRAQAEEMRKKTFLPYRQGLLGCLGFSSKSYGAWNGFTRALNPVSSR